MSKKIGYLGPAGTFSEIIAQKYIGTSNAIAVPGENFPNLIFDTNSGKLDECIVPIESSVEGTVGVVNDILALKNIKIKISGELVLTVHHCLIVKQGIRMDQITDVFSHPQAIDQCMEFIRKNLPKAKMHFTYSTAAAVSHVKNTSAPSGSYFAAIASESSAKQDGLIIAAKNINGKESSTRFVVLSKKDASRSGRDKTAIVFSIPKDRPGGLYDILGDLQKINLTRIESRPSKKGLGDYLFFIDMEGHIKDDKIKKAIDAIKKRASYFKILGSYPRLK